MWILFAFLSAFFAGITSIFAKISIKGIDSDLITAMRTIVIFCVTLLLVLIMKSFNGIETLNFNDYLFLILSGFATALLWICYFRALWFGNVSDVAPIDKSSIIITTVASYLFLQENLTFINVFSILLIALGTIIVTLKKDNPINKKCLIYAILTAVLTSVATILGKVGLKRVEPFLANFFRTTIVLIIIWIYVIIKKKQKNISLINNKNYKYIFLSGISTAFSWTFYFLALKRGETSMVFALEKLGIILTMTFSYLILKEPISKKTIFGTIIIVIGTVFLICYR